MQTGGQMSLVTRTALVADDTFIMAAVGTTAFVVLRQNTIEILEAARRANCGPKRRASRTACRR